MASCSLGGASTIKLSNFYSDFTRSNSCSLHPTYGIRTSVRQKSLHFAGLVLSRVPTKPLILSCSPSTETTTSSNIEDSADEKISTGRKSPLIPNSFEVQSLLTEICDTSSIAEFELKLGGFQLYVKRDLAGKSKPSHSPSPALVNTTSTPADTSDVNEPVTTTSLALSKPAPRTRGLQSWLVRAEDEGLAILNSPRVGVFRIARTKKGKRGPPACKENQVVKEGKVLCYIEQLGCQFPVQSDVSGEVVKILREDGDPIGYGDALVAVLPSFPGIKKLSLASTVSSS